MKEGKCRHSQLIASQEIQGFRFNIPPNEQRWWLYSYAAS